MQTDFNDALGEGFTETYLQEVEKLKQSKVELERETLLRLKNLHYQIKILNQDIKEVKDEATCNTDQRKGLDKAEVGTLDKVAKAFVLDNFEDAKEKWEAFESKFEELSETL